LIEIVSLLQELDEQATAKALELQQVGEGLRPTVDQKQQFQEVAGLRGELEKLKAEHSQEIFLLQKQIADLAKDKESLEERNKFLQEKNKTITKNHKSNSLVLLLYSCKVVDCNILHLFLYLYSNVITQNSKSC